MRAKHVFDPDVLSVHARVRVGDALRRLLVLAESDRHLVALHEDADSTPERISRDEVRARHALKLDALLVLEAITALDKRVALGAAASGRNDHERQ